MKQPLKRDYRMAVYSYNLNPENWMLQKDGDVYITIVNKMTGVTKIIDKYARERKGDVYGIRKCDDSRLH